MIATFALTSPAFDSGGAVPPRHTCDGEDVLFYGSGYGHTGLDPRNISAAELDEVFAAVEENARDFFPTAYEQARARQTGVSVEQLRAEQREAERTMKLKDEARSVGETD